MQRWIILIGVFAIAAWTFLLPPDRQELDVPDEAPPPNRLQDLAPNIQMGGGGTIYTSTTGATWTAVTSGSTCTREGTSATGVICVTIPR